MTAEQINELERLAALATPGPWFVTCNCTGKTFYTIKNGRVYIGEALGVYNGEANAAYIAAACNAVPELIKMYREAEDKANNALRILLEAQGRIVEVQKRVRELEQERELYRERLYESWNQTEYCINLLHDAGVNLTMWACGVESCQQCDIPECDMGDLDMVEKYTLRKAKEDSAKKAGE